MNYTDVIPGCSHFTFHDALYLPSWSIHHIPTQNEIDNITKQGQKLEEIRALLNVPMNIHCWLRPILNNPASAHHGMDYNAFVKGAKHSAHKLGLATDWDASGLSCDHVRSLLIPQLETLNIRMEDNGMGSPWVHIDIMPIGGGHRYFKP